MGSEVRSEPTSPCGEQPLLLPQVLNLHLKEIRVGLICLLLVFLPHKFKMDWYK